MIGSQKNMGEPQRDLFTQKSEQMSQIGRTLEEMMPFLLSGDADEPLVEAVDQHQ